MSADCTRIGSSNLCTRCAAPHRLEDALPQLLDPDAGHPARRQKLVRRHPELGCPGPLRLEQAGLADVGPPHEGDLGEPGVERLEWIGEAADELDRQPGEDHASLIWRGRSVTTMGGLPSVMHSGVTITSRTSSREGRSNIRSVITVSRIARSPRAPVERLIAFRATARSASWSKVSPTSSNSNSLTYCLVMAFLG